MTYRVQFAVVPEGWDDLDDIVLEAGIPEDDLAEAIKRAQAWNAEAPLNEDAGMPLDLAYILGAPLGRVEIVSEDGERVAIPTREALSA